MKKQSSWYSSIKPYLPWVLLGGVILLAIGMRFWHLNTLPPGLHPDEAANGIDIFRILERHDWRVIYNTNGPRETLFFYLQAGFVAAMGNTILALRMAPALFGVLAVVMVYLLTKEWFGRRTALVAAFLMAVNPWVVIISRDGFRASLVPFFIATVLYLATLAYRRGKTIWFVLAGVAFGLGFYTYTAYAALALVLVAVLLIALIWRRTWTQKHFKQLGFAAISLAVVLLPLVVTIVRHPNDSSARAGGTSFLNSELNHGKPLQTLGSSVAKTILQYNVAGDQNPRHNIPGQPLVNTFVGIMLLVGILVALYNIKQLRYSVLLLTFAALLLPAAISAESLPHALRSIGTAVPVMILAAVGINYLLLRWYQTFPLNSPARLVGLYLILFLLLLTAIQGIKGYFWAWGQDPQTYAAYNEDMTAIANYLNSRQSNATTYLVSGGYSALPVEYLTHNKSKYELLDASSLQSLPIGGSSKRFIVPADSNAASQLTMLQAKFPASTTDPQISSFSGKVLFYVVQTN